MSARPSAVALIPARAGSSRLPDKNVRIVAGHPMLAYTIAAAQASGVFDQVIVSTDSPRYAAIARHYGAQVPFLRPAELAGDSSPDIAWIDHLLRELAAKGQSHQLFAILRPTSPLRTPAVIADAMRTFLSAQPADSLRAVEPVTQHPGKMWTRDGDRLVPLLGGDIDGVPWHSNATQFLPRVWVQNASLEVAWTRCVLDDHSISGTDIVAFDNPPPAGFDVNTGDDFERLLRLVADDPSLLPPIDVDPPNDLRETQADDLPGATHG